MRIRRLPHAVVALATLAAPFAALAQPATNGDVTTAPLPTAPVMDLPVLVLLAVVLTGVAAYLLRRSVGRAIAMVSFVAVLTALAGLGYAVGMTNMIVVQGAQCAMQTTQMFDPLNPNTLVSHCPNSIQIISIQRGICNVDNLSVCSSLGLCSVGQVLADGDSCTLPTCVC